MTEERAVREQIAEFAPIVGTLIAMIKAEHETYIQAQRFRPPDAVLLVDRDSAHG